MNRYACAVLFAAILPVLIGAAIWPRQSASSQSPGGSLKVEEAQFVDPVEPLELQKSHVVEARPALPPPLSEFENEMNRLRRDLELAISLLEKSFGRPVQLENVRTAPVTLTAYSSTPDQCDSTPHITASNKPVRHGVIAVSDDIIKELGLGFGQRVLIPGHGVFEVMDRMNPRWHRRVDIWHDDREAARLFGIQKGTMLWIGRSQAEQANAKEKA